MKNRTSRQNMIKLLALALAMVLTLGNLPLMSFADGGGNYTYRHHVHYYFAKQKVDTSDLFAYGTSSAHWWPANEELQPGNFPVITGTMFSNSLDLSDDTESGVQTGKHYLYTDGKFSDIKLSLKYRENDQWQDTEVFDPTIDGYNTPEMREYFAKAIAKTKQGFFKTVDSETEEELEVTPDKLREGYFTIHPMRYIKYISNPGPDEYRRIHVDLYITRTKAKPVSLEYKEGDNVIDNTLLNGAPTELTGNVGDVKTFSAPEIEGYELDSVKLDGTDLNPGNNGEYSVTLKDITQKVTLNYSKKKFTVTLTVTKGGIPTTIQKKHTVVYGANEDIQQDLIELASTNIDGYTFDKNYINNIEFNDTTINNVTQDVEVEVRFVKKPDNGGNNGGNNGNGDNNGGNNGGNDGGIGGGGGDNGGGYGGYQPYDSKGKDTSGDTVIEENETPLGTLNTEDFIAYIQGYPDGSVRPDAYVNRQETAAIFFRLLEPKYRETVRSTANDFKDVNENNWSNKHISTLAKGGILNGYATGDFRPSDAITRAELAAIAAKFDKLENTASHNFTDIKGHWAEKYIANASAKGWIKGYPNGEFKPDTPITRAEFVTFVNKVLGRSVKKSEVLPGVKMFTDLTADAWYYEAMVTATNSYNAIKGDDGYQKWTELITPVIEM